MFLSSSIFKLLVGCFILWGGLFYFTIESTVSIWYRSETFAHCFIILPICIYLIKQNWRQLNQATIEPNLKVGFVIALVLMIWLFGALAELLVIEQGAAFLLLPIIIWLVLGNAVARILAFTMFFWMFSVPVGEFLIPRLQELTADITVWALQLTGIPVFRDGLFIAIPGGLFEVAVACSGIRYLIASFTLGTLFAYLNFNSTKKRTLFILFSIVLPLVANGIRAYGIVMIAHLSDMKYATGVDHLVYGWLFFGVVILLMFAIGNVWADPLEAEDKSELKQNAQPILNASIATAFLACLLLVAGANGYREVVSSPDAGEHPELSSIVEFKRDISDQSWMPIFNNATGELSGQFKKTDIYLAYYHENRNDSELINSTNQIFNIKNWAQVSSNHADRFSTKIINNARGRKRLLLYSYLYADKVTPSASSIKLAQALSAFTGSAQSGAVLVMSVPVGDEETDKKRLEKQFDTLVKKAQQVLFDAE